MLLNQLVIEVNKEKRRVACHAATSSQRKCNREPPRSACPAAIARPRGRAAEPGGGARPLASAQGNATDAGEGASAALGSLAHAPGRNGQRGVHKIHLRG